MFSPGIHRNCPEKHIDEEIVNNLCYFRGLGWLPDGEHLIFSAEQVGDSGFEVYKMRADGKELQRVILEPWSGHCCVGSPVLSPDRRSIIIHNMDIRSSDVHIVDLDTATSYPLTSSLDIGSQLSWSPDGQWITFTVRENGSGEIYRVHPDGTEFQRITQNQIYEVDPVWSPDGQWILFRSSWSATLRQDIYRIRPDGSDLQQLTDDPVCDIPPSWSPPIRVPFHPILSIILGITCLLGGSLGRLPKIER